jgi:hypothetical protein
VNAVTDSTALSGAGEQDEDLVSGGYTVTGTYYTGEFATQTEPGNLDKTMNLEVLVVSLISNDTWLYDVHTQAGAVGFNQTSEFISSTQDLTT